LSGTATGADLRSRTSSSTTFSGSDVPKSTVIMRSSDGGAFTGTYDTDYDLKPSLTALAGTFNGTGLSGFSSVQSIPVTISSAGTISTPPSLGCSALGTVVPRPGGKNIFNVSVTSSGSNCALGNGTTTSIAYYDVTTRELLVMALNSSKTDGFIDLGAK